MEVRLEMARKPKVADGQVIQYTTLKVRLYPTEAQAEHLEPDAGRPAAVL